MSIVKDPELEVFADPRIGSGPMERLTLGWLVSNPIVIVCETPPSVTEYKLSNIMKPRESVALVLKVNVLGCIVTLDVLGIV